MTDATKWVLVAAAVVNLTFVRTLQPTTIAGSIVLACWLLLPYAVLAYIVARPADRTARIGNILATTLVAGGGVLFLTLVIFVRPDPQGGIAVLFTPVYQCAAMVIVVPLSRWIAAKIA
jgi:hypothetical protein